MGSGQCTASASTAEDVESFWESGVFTSATPLGLRRILFFCMSMNFGVRSGQEHRNLKWGDIGLERDHSGWELLTHTERQTKTSSGENPKDKRKCVPQLWAQPHMKERIQFLCKRSMQTKTSGRNDPASPFCISVIYRKHYDLSQPWYKTTSVGRNTLQSMMKSASDAYRFIIWLLIRAPLEIFEFTRNVQERTKS